MAITVGLPISMRIGDGEPINVGVCTWEATEAEPVIGRRHVATFLRDAARDLDSAVVDEPRRFYLQRDTDVTGVSGEGRVADGVLWPDGTASVRWRGDHPSVVFWDRGQASVDHVHGHNGMSRIVWIDEES